MAPLSLKIVQDGGAITRTVLFDTTTRVRDALEIVKEKLIIDDNGKDYGLFLTSADDELSGVWLEGHRPLDYYMLRDGDSLLYLCRNRNLRVRMLDGSVKTMQIDESKCVGDLMMVICDKIGITNHDEYGLCFEQVEQIQEEKPVTGTLTLKRKQQTREKDAQMEQLSKKLKTDDNVEWLEQHKTLREIGVDAQQTLLLKRRLFYSDRNVDARDPVQLNLLYVQTRDAVLDGRQVLTEEKAIEFAGIQCQVQYGDFQEDKHKPGFLENLKEFLPEQYAGSWGAERKVLKEYSKHHGLSPLEAKHLYTQNARELPTYGVTFFLVKEQQKGKKKLVPRLLGINAESILRLDEVTKEILQVWKLTQVKTFKAGKEMFTLDFGDYSDKQYTVKTNEAQRIRDILQGYIDIVHRALAAPYNPISYEGEVICEDNVQSSKGHIIQNVVPMKVVEQSYVGPSKLIPYAQGTEAQQGTQVMTVQQIISTNKVATQQKGVSGQTGVFGNNSMEYLKKLNRINTYSVEMVAFLTDPHFKQVDKVKKVQALSTIIEEDMNNIIEGVHKSVENDNEEVRRKILSELDELCASFKDFIDTSHEKDFGTLESLDEAQNAAEKIVGHGTQLYCSLDPGIKRRSRILRRSHKSFIEDDKTEATLRRASFLAAAAHACKAVDGAKNALDMTFEGSIPEGEEVCELELAARQKVGKLSAAVAILMSAQTDPDNLDYTAAITSMTTIDELLPELIQDVKGLGSVKDDRSRISLLSKVRALCDATRNICAMTGDEDKEKMQDLALKYAKSSDKLIFTLGRGSVPDKENQVMDLSRDVGAKSALLVQRAGELARLAGGPRAPALLASAARCGDRSDILLACAQLTAPSITEPHCQSAMSAGAAALAAAAQRLALAWKPLVEQPGCAIYDETLQTLCLDLMKALDRLKQAYTDLSEESSQDNDEVKQRDRLKFIASVKDTISKISETQKELDKPCPVSSGDNKELERLLGQRLALLNSYIASLIRAIADKENPDYATAEEAVALVSDLIPDLVRDMKTISGTKDEKTGRAQVNETRALLDAIKDVCATTEDNTMQETNGASSNFARHSSKLCYAFIPRTDPRKENMMIDLAKKTCEQASELLTHVNQAVDEVEEGQLLDAQGARLVDVVQALLTTAQITASSFADARCQSTLLGVADDVSSASQRLAETWAPLVRGPAHQQLRQNLHKGQADLETALNNLRAVCQKFGEENNKSQDPKSEEKERERLRFVATMTSTKNKILDAEKMLEKPINDIVSEDKTVVQSRLADQLAQLNAAIAALVRATNDSNNVDYNAAEQSIAKISQLLPDVINETHSLSNVNDDVSQRAMLRELQKLFNATRDICKYTEQGDTQAINDTALDFAEASGKLTYVFKPKSPSRNNNITKLTTETCNKASKLLTDVHELGKNLEGEDGTHLDDCGVKLVNASKSLLTTAQILEPSLSNPICKNSLLSAIDDVSSLSEELKAAWSPAKRQPQHKTAVDSLEKENNELKLALDNLRSICKDFKDEDIGLPEDIQVRKRRDVEAKRTAPNADLVKMNRLSKEMYNIASDMTDDVSTLAAGLPGEEGERLVRCGEGLVDAVQHMYSVVAEEVQAPKGRKTTDNALVAIAGVSAASCELADAYSPMKQDPEYKDVVEQLEAKKNKLETALDDLRDTYGQYVVTAAQAAARDSDELTEKWLTSQTLRSNAVYEDVDGPLQSEEQRLKFISTLSDAKKQILEAKNELEKPSAPAPVSSSPDHQRRLAQRLAHLNAAIASLIHSTDPSNSDYKKADEAVKIINECLPQIIQDSKTLPLDGAARNDMLDSLKTLCEATRDVYLESELGQAKNAYEPITKLVDASSKLCYVYNPRANIKRENLIVELSKAVCDKAAVLLSQVCQVAAGAAGAAGRGGALLDARGARVVDAAQLLLTVAQLTASSIDDPTCQATLLKSADEVSTLADKVEDTWTSLLQDPQQQEVKDQLGHKKKELLNAINELRAACKDATDTTLKPLKPAVPKRISTLDQTEDKKQFAKSIDEAINNIEDTEEEIRKIRDIESVSLLSEGAAAAAERLERKLVLANVAASHLVICNDPENINYKGASKSANNLAELIPTIVIDTRDLYNSPQLQGKPIVDDSLALCEATKTLCRTAKDNNEKLNEAAVDFANKSAKVLYGIGSQVDPEQERQVLSRAKVIGDCASRLATCGAAAAQRASARAAGLARCGTRCADAASKLLYVTKLVAPLIQHPESQSILLTAADQLSSKVKQYSSIWKPLSSQPEQTSIKDLEVESKSLEKLLDGLKHDIKNETLVRRRKETTLKIENSPMRQLASDILYNYKSYMECSDLPMEERRRYAQDADKLTAAIKELDAANSYSKQSPEDINKLRRLENATQDLQRMILQSRRGGGGQSNVVDVMDYVKDVAANIETVSKTAQETNGEYGRKELQMIKEECNKMSALANETMSPSETQENDGFTDDMLRIDGFASVCEKTMHPMNDAARNIDDIKSRRALQIKMQSLTDSINMLRFAVKGALATADSAALDESLHDLTELENRIDSMLKPNSGVKIPHHDNRDSAALSALCCVAACPHGAADQLAPALAAYVTDLRMRTHINSPKEKRRLEEHLRKLLLLLRTLMIATSRRYATWQEHNTADDMIITDQIIQELEDFASNGKANEEQNKVVDNVDVRRLLLPSGDIHLQGDKNDLKKKFHQTVLKMDSMMGTVTSNIQKPQNLSRTLHTVTDVAIELDSLAHALKNVENRVQCHRIEESAKDMRFAIFKLLKVAEQVSKEPDSMYTRRRLSDAIRSLNKSINKLSCVTDGEVRQELSSSVVLACAQASSARRYPHCLQAVLDHADVIYKLKNDEVMSREEGYSTLQYITTSVCNISEHAAQCAYLISISDKYKDVAKEGLPDIIKMQEVSESMQDNCIRIICSGNINQVKHLQSELNENGRQLQAVIIESKNKVIDSSDEKDLTNAAAEINTATKEFDKILENPNTSMTQISTSTLKILDAIAVLNAVIKRPTILPKATNLSEETSSAFNDVVKNSSELVNKTVSLVNTINSKGGVTCWKTYDSYRTELLRAFDALLNSIRENGRRAGLLESTQAPEEEETDVQKKSHIETQMDSAKKWLKAENSSEDVRSHGIQGIINMVNIAKQMAEDLKDVDKEEMSQTIDEVEKLSMECSFKYNKEKSSLLWERLQELKKMLDRFVVTRVVEDFLEDGTALDDIELLVDVEKDEAKRKYLLELKIAELLAQMSRMTRTARLAADAGPPHVGADLAHCSQQVELLAPTLVKATQERINTPQQQAVTEKYKALMAEYAESLSKVRILCDRSVDPVDFVQAAGETMQRMREQSAAQDDPLKSAHTSNVITKLGWRVLEAGLHSRHAAHDAELRRALAQAQRRLLACTPGAGARASQQRDWRHVTAEILSTTNEVESALSGENIFQKQPDPNQPIFAAALDLHAAVRGWSARDNAVVAVAKRMAVLMARLADYMQHDKKPEVLATSKATVKASIEVTKLARKLALECSDLRIRTNLVQVCDRIPTISGQLKMLTTVKGASLGQQDNQEDKEAINMLVGNAQNLMLSVQEVVSAAASASVKIMSQRGPRLRWVRKNCYHNY
ncbi:PREDICTED: talin-1-like isoform X2 [Papilio polytes]|uniref:talin-1-like isoform X2 n=1 Tax=Papilio polytes TaxID=76194 RepID=UPI0006760D83|nr:PREDICTED: talin-1-like isoform X2 [Papilio polytes]